MKSISFLICNVLIICMILSCNPKVVKTVKINYTQAQNQKSSGFVSLHGERSTPSGASDRVKKSGVRSMIEGNKIIQIIDGKDLPITLNENFRNDHETLIIKVENYKNPSISGQLVTKVQGFDIRFNQIKTAKGEFDGPFGLTIDYKTPDPGEIWLIIGRDLMASTVGTDEFVVKLK